MDGKLLSGYLSLINMLLWLAAALIALHGHQTE
jgi:hypothetical protein